MSQRELELEILLRRALLYEVDAWEQDEDVNGGDLVEWFGEWRQDVKDILDPPNPPTYGRERERLDNEE